MRNERSTVPTFSTTSTSRDRVCSSPCNACTRQRTCNAVCQCGGVPVVLLRGNTKRWYGCSIRRRRVTWGLTVAGGTHTVLTQAETRPIVLVPRDHESTTPLLYARMQAQQRRRTASPRVCADAPEPVRSASVWWITFGGRYGVVRWITLGVGVVNKID
jgi:hypothetical protein